LGTHLAQEQQANGWATKRGRLATLDPGFMLARNPDTVRAPDLAYVSRERHPDAIRDGFPPFAPDLAQVVVYRADGSVTVLGLRDTPLGDTVLPGFAMALAVLFTDE